MNYLKDILAALGLIATILLATSAVINIAVQVGGDHNKIEQKIEVTPKSIPSQVGQTTSPQTIAPAKVESSASSVIPVETTPAAVPKVAQSKPAELQHTAPAQTYRRSYSTPQYTSPQEEDCSCPVEEEEECEDCEEVEDGEVVYVEVEP